VVWCDNLLRKIKGETFRTFAHPPAEMALKRLVAPTDRAEYGRPPSLGA